jgi:hypothetical protein
MQSTAVREREREHGRKRETEYGRVWQRKRLTERRTDKRIDSKESKF